jgi:hypothetical protein
MAGSDPKMAPDSALVALGRKMAGLGREADALPHAADLPGAAPGGFELVLAELIGDANGEVVVFNDSNLRSLTLRTDAAVVADGQAAPHVTAAGADVAGCRFVTFENGLTLYFQKGLELVVQPPG